MIRVIRVHTAFQVQNTKRVECSAELNCWSLTSRIRWPAFW